MYRISELAARVGLSRSTLLYYEKRGLIAGRRMANGYRAYDDRDVQRIRLLQQLQTAGLSLKECKRVLETGIDRAVLEQRYRTIGEDIERLLQARSLIGALLGESEQGAFLRKWFALAPDAQMDWLKIQGFDEKEALRLKWLPKDMNEHDQYMKDFLTVFETLDRWGPGSVEDTLRALEKVPFAARAILDIGCSNGISTVTLAQNSEAHITALDNEQSALDRLQQKLQDLGLTERVETVCQSMLDMDFGGRTFDLIWAEASVYIMGFEKALRAWKKHLSGQGVIVVSDLVWLTDSPSPEALAFWESEYPDMVEAQARIRQID
ncbi:MAG: MerR family transcriptional regulator, partial [Alcanivoracaceae bacterium]